LQIFPALRIIIITITIIIIIIIIIIALAPTCLRCQGLEGCQSRLALQLALSATNEHILPGLSATPHGGYHTTAQDATAHCICALGHLTLPLSVAASVCVTSAVAASFAQLHWVKTEQFSVTLRSQWEGEQQPLLTYLLTWLGKTERPR
jgi:hypothetical protein